MKRKAKAKYLDNFTDEQVSQKVLDAIRAARAFAGISFVPRQRIIVSLVGVDVSHVSSVIDQLVISGQLTRRNKFIRINAPSTVS